MFYNPGNVGSYEAYEFEDFDIMTVDKNFDLMHFATVYDHQKSNNGSRLFAAIKDRRNVPDEVEVFVSVKNIGYYGLAKVDDEYINNGVGDCQKYGLVWLLLDELKRDFNNVIRTKAFKEMDEDTRIVVRASYTKGRRINVYTNPSLNADVDAMVLGFDRNGNICVAVVHSSKGYIIDKVHCSGFFEGLNEIAKRFE